MYLGNSNNRKRFMIEGRLWCLNYSNIWPKISYLHDFSSGLDQPGSVFTDLSQEATSLMTDFSFHFL